MRIEQIKAYLGFAIRSGKVIFGSDKLFITTKMPSIVLISSDQNDKVTNKVIRFCQINDIKLFKLDMELSSIIGRDNCKVISVLDESLASAIAKELEMEK